MSLPVAGWSYDPIQLIIPAGSVTGTLENFPVMVKLSTSSGSQHTDISKIFTALGSDANRTRICLTTSDGTPLYTEIAEWDTANKTAYLWVRVPRIEPSTATTMYLYYDPAHAPMTEFVGDTGSAAAQQVWSNGYAGVWHMKNTGGQVLDSSPNGNHGTIYGATETDGPIGRCLHFNGVDSYVSVPNDPTLQITGDLTVEVDYYIESLTYSTGPGLVEKKYNGEYCVGGYASQMTFTQKSDAGVGYSYYAYTPIAAGNRYGFAAARSYTDKTVRLVYSGIHGGAKTYSGEPLATPNDLVFGRWIDASRSLHGEIHSIQISNVTRSVAWMAAHHISLQDELITYKQPRPVSPMILLQTDDGRTTDYTQVYPLASAKGIPMTFNVIAGWAGTGQYMSWDQIRELRDAGHGIECHTLDHSNVTTLTESALRTNLEAVNARFLANGLPIPEHHCYPGTSNDATSRAIIAEYRLSGRGGPGAPEVISEWGQSIDWYRLKAQTMFVREDQTIDGVKTLIDNAIENHEVLILLTHDVSDEPTQYGTHVDRFAEILDYVAAKRDAGLIEPVTIDGLYRAMQGIRTRPVTERMTFHGETTGATYDKTVDYVGFVWGTTRHNNPEGTAPGASGYDHHWISSSGDYTEDDFFHAATAYTAGAECYYRAAARIDGTWYYGEELTYVDPDTVSGTNGRYQAVTGTVAYDDTNKRMNVTTAAGANGKASGRLKSYKFCEGAQQFDVTLPVGADGDFICMVTHATNPAMTNGIGVGLQSDGAGNWNLATLSGTTVTVGASSGLTDGKTARIEIEKDITGAYWYYIYDAAGTKPTTATGKLYTTLTEGYTGWYANGNSKTYAIDNISIRAESIVGRTNVEVTEDVFNSVTGEIEARTYFKPIHRGAMLETYHDGTQEVVGTTFIDDCQWDRRAEWVKFGASSSTATRDTVNGNIRLAVQYSGTQVFYRSTIPLRGGLYTVFTSSDSHERSGLFLGSDGTSGGDGVSYNIINGIKLGSFTQTGNSGCGVFLDGVRVLDVKTTVSHLGKLMQVLWLPESNYLAIYLDGVLNRSYTNPVLGDSRLGGFCGVWHGHGTSSTPSKFSNIQFIAASSDATNGIAACIPPIGGGARYGVEESVYNTFTTENVNKGVYLTTAKVKTTNPNADEASLEYTNDTTSITLNTTPIDVDATYTVKTTPITIDANETDTLRVSVKNSTTCVQSTNYVDSLSLIPVSGDDVLYPQDLAFISGVKPSQKRKVEVK